MSFNKHYRKQWIALVYASAVSLFHQERKLKANAEKPLADLARACANTEFANRAHLIVGDREELAKEFMAHCRDNFGKEISAAIASRARIDIETTQLEEAPAS